MTGDHCTDLLLKADNLMLEGETRKALSLLKEAETVEPANPQVACLLGTLYARKQEWKKARDHANRAHGAMSSDLTYLKALIAAHLGNLELANELVDSMFHRDLRSDEDNAFLASFYLETGQDALAQISAEHISPDSIGGFRVRLAVLWHQRDKIAIRALINEMPADNYALLILRSRYCYALRDFSGCLESARGAESIHPGSPPALKYIVCSSYWLRDWDECIREGESLLERGELEPISGNLAVFAALRKLKIRVALRLIRGIDLDESKEVDTQLARQQKESKSRH